MGRDKALLPWPPVKEGFLPTETFLSAAVRSLASATDFVVVVAGKNAAALSPIAYAVGASVVINPDPGRGQFSSLRIGLGEVLNRGRDAALVTLVDRPAARAATVSAIREAFETAPLDIWAIVPEFGGVHGHPYAVGREMIEQFLQAPDESNARDVEHRVQEHVQYLPVEDPLIAMNINTPEEYAALKQQP